MKDENEKLLDHEYDGIQELDNRLPRWWVNKFWLTILFSGLYLVYYSIGPGRTIDEEWKKDVDNHELARLDREYKEANEAPDESKLVALAREEESRKKGAEVYGSKCASCHGAQGQGGIGPNLTDNAWLHGGKLVQVAQTISKGVAEKGMPPWGAVLSKPELYAAVAFIRSIRGTNPAGAKPPQGNIEKE